MFGADANNLQNTALPYIREQFERNRGLTDPDELRMCICVMCCVTCTYESCYEYMKKNTKIWLRSLDDALVAIDDAVELISGNIVQGLCKPLFFSFLHIVWHAVPSASSNRLPGVYSCKTQIDFETRLCNF